MESLVFTQASDVWSFGIMLVELAQDGDRPYHDTKSSANIMGFVMAGHRHEQPQGCSDELYMVMMRCWNVEPKERPLFISLAETFDQLFAVAKATHRAAGGVCQDRSTLQTKVAEDTDYFEYQNTGSGQSESESTTRDLQTASSAQNKLAQIIRFEYDTISRVHSENAEDVRLRHQNSACTRSNRTEDIENAQESIV
jgi:serine/threonine protein kinase